MPNGLPIDDLPPVAPPWPRALCATHEEFQREHARWRDEWRAQERGARERLEAIVEAVRLEYPQCEIAAQLFDCNSQVGIGLRFVDSSRPAIALRRPVQGFDAQTLRQIINDHIGN